MCLYLTPFVVPARVLLHQAILRCCNSAFLRQCPPPFYVSNLQVCAAANVRAVCGMLAPSKCCRPVPPCTSTSFALFDHQSHLKITSGTYAMPETRLAGPGAAPSASAGPSNRDLLLPLLASMTRPLFLRLPMAFPWRLCSVLLSLGRWRLHGWGVGVRGGCVCDTCARCCALNWT